MSRFNRGMLLGLPSWLVASIAMALPLVWIGSHAMDDQPLYVSASDARPMHVASDTRVYDQARASARVDVIRKKSEQGIRSLLVSNGMAVTLAPYASLRFGRVPGGAAGDRNTAANHAFTIVREQAYSMAAAETR
jgi:hypothetical protein